MIYYLYFLILVIVGTCSFIAVTLKWFLNVKSNYDPRKIIVKYELLRPVDFASSIVYMNKDDLHKSRYYSKDMPTIIIDDDHKQYMIKQVVGKVVKAMIEQKAVSIKDEIDYYNPLMNRLDLQMKVYVPKDYEGKIFNQLDYETHD